MKDVTTPSDEEPRGHENIPDDSVVPVDEATAAETRAARWRANLLAGELLIAERAGNLKTVTHAVAWDDGGESSVMARCGDHVVLRIVDDPSEDGGKAIRIESAAAGLQPVCIWYGGDAAATGWEAQEFELELATLIGLDEKSQPRSLAAAGRPCRSVIDANAKFGFAAIPFESDTGRRLRLQLIGHESFEGKAVVEIRVGTADSWRQTPDSASVPIFRSVVDLMKDGGMERSQELDEVMDGISGPFVGAELELPLPDRLPRFSRALLLVRPLTANEALIDDGMTEVELLKETAPDVYSVERQKCRLGLGKGMLKSERGFLLTLAESVEQFEKVYECVERLSDQLKKYLHDPEDFGRLRADLQKSVRGGVVSPCMNEDADRNKNTDRYVIGAAKKRQPQLLRELHKGNATGEADDDEERAVVSMRSRRRDTFEKDMAVAEDNVLEFISRNDGATVLRRIIAILPEMHPDVTCRAAWLLRYFGWREYADAAIVVNSPIEAWRLRLMPHAEVANLIGKSVENVRQAVSRINAELFKRLQAEGWLDEDGNW